MYLFLFLQMPLNVLLEVKSLSLPREISNSFTVAWAQVVPWTRKKHAPVPPQTQLDLCFGKGHDSPVMRAGLPLWDLCSHMRYWVQKGSALGLIVWMPSGNSFCILFWLCWLFIAAWASLQLWEAGDTLQPQRSCFSLLWLLLLRSMGSRMCRLQ